jgi:hypothetical protein
MFRIIALHLSIARLRAAARREKTSQQPAQHDLARFRGTRLKTRS